jgi:hypothetical protein
MIHAARASPIAGEEENPEPLHPLAAHRPGTPAIFDIVDLVTRL